MFYFDILFIHSGKLSATRNIINGFILAPQQRIRAKKLIFRNDLGQEIILMFYFDILFIHSSILIVWKYFLAFNVQSIIRKDG